MINVLLCNIMKKRTLYLETSLFGFYYDEKLWNKEKRESVRKLFKQIREGYFQDAFVSTVTLAELGRAEGDLGEKLLTLVKKYGFKELVIDKQKVADLADLYIQKMAVLTKWPDDAMHIAIAAAAGVDVLVTLNCEHIDNEETIDTVKEVNKRAGYGEKLDIRRPEEVIFYEN